MTAHDDRHERLLNEVSGALSAHDASPERLAAMRQHVRNAGVRGGTTFRDAPAPSRWGLAFAGFVVVAAALVLLVWPSLDRGATVSAAEILGRSRAALSNVTTGIEVLTYELSVEGVLAELLPAEQSGRFTVEETIDHDHPGRYRLLKIAPDGQVVGGFAHDPQHGIRTGYVRAHGRGYLLRFTGADQAGLSPLAMKRMAFQALITLMQAESNPAVREVTCDDEPCYEVTIADASAASSALIDLAKGRALITAADARMVEVSVAGQVAQRPFGLAFVLRERRLATSPAAAGTFELTARPGDVILEGNASTNPMWDVIERALAAVPPPTK